MVDLDISKLRIDESFASKVSRPEIELDLSTIEFENPVQAETIQTKGRMQAEEIRSSNYIYEKPITLALNIPTYINLYGYGYKNVYELSELISVHDERIQFEGTDMIPVEN